ncbi:hypothetical protein BGX27_003540 [Mortierella sp. AM989]|nr:hypothetical protein BGX27_003540 [Mortierella sp. AM989]
MISKAEFLRDTKASDPNYIIEQFVQLFGVKNVEEYLNAISTTLEELLDNDDEQSQKKEQYARWKQVVETATFRASCSKFFSKKTAAAAAPVLVTTLNLCCVVSGELASTAFPVEISSDLTVGKLKKAIKEENPSIVGDAKDLELLRVMIPTGKGVPNRVVSADDITDKDKEEMMGGGVISDYFNDGASGNTIHIIVEPRKVLKRGLEYEPETSRKVSKIDDWTEYQANDGPVDLPPVLIKLLSTKEFTPAPREEFRRQLDDKHVGDEITLPSLGQEPKHYGLGYQGKSFFITEQMERMWEEFSANSTHSIKRVLSGPMGVGKSYLALFLAAKAYAEGWLMLYISDASVLVNEGANDSAEEICKRFFALNKDILTTADLEEMVAGRPTEEEVPIRATTKILRHLLCRKDQKTLLIIDEHGALFQKDTSPKPNLLAPLINLTDWAQDRNGARVVFTGTAHAGYERHYITSDISDWLEFVTPLSDFIFDKLLAMIPALARDTIKREMKKITNKVPRELIKLAEFVAERHDDCTGLTDSTISEIIEKFSTNRYIGFYKQAHTYFFKELTGLEQYSQRSALSTMFQPRRDGYLDEEYAITAYGFMDLGLVYRRRIKGDVMYQFLCPAAKQALPDVYRTMPLPIDVVDALRSGILDGDGFEDAIFHFFVRHTRIILETTNLAGVQAAPLHIDAKHFGVVTNPPSEASENTLLRCYRDYPRFDYIYNRTFIQVSISDFASHNEKSADISKAFDRPKLNDTQSKSIDSSKSSNNTKRNRRVSDTFDSRNQIERYLDSAFGGKHKADIDPTSRRFVVTKDGEKLDDFKIVYICGLKDTPNHTRKVKEFPDIVHVNLGEIKRKLCGDLLPEQSKRWR